ncbi:MAG: co-chaperone GroES [Clostridia bacterium]|jgi:co-chaperonin GroES (HSP10)
MDNIPDNFIPLAKHVLIKREDEIAEKGGIIIPEVYRERGSRAEVVEIGEGVKNIVKGDQILYWKEYTVLPFNERNMAITEDKYILATIVIDVVAGNVERIIPMGAWVMIRMDRPSGRTGDIVLSDKTESGASWGTVVRTGVDCKMVKPEKRVYFETNKGMICVENDTKCRLIEEKDILCVLD